MWRAVCVIAGLCCGWTACSGSEGEPEDPETRRQSLRGCILKRLPPAESGAAEWTVSGYALVDAYTRCLDGASAGTAADFRAVVAPLAVLGEEPSRVSITAAPERVR